MGLGHIHRLLALSEYLREQFTCNFIIRAPLPGIRKLILDKCNQITELSVMDVSQEIETISKLLKKGEIIVLDGYAFSTEYQKRLKESGCGVVSVDDIHQFHFFADIIINSAGGVAPSLYSMEPYTQLFTGPRYAFVKKAFQLSMNRSEQSGNNSLLICMGGADPRNHTVSTLNHCSNFDFDVIYVVIGEAYLHSEVLESEKKKLPLRVEVLKDIAPVQLADVMKKCAVAICSASGIAYEYLSVGGELYVKKTADNQSLLYDYLIKDGLAFDFKEFRATKERTISSLAKQKEIFDGNSQKRILKLFHKLDFDLNAVVRKATESDLAIVFNWANEPETRRQSHNSKPITLEAHTSWFLKKIRDPATLMYIFEYKKIPVALVRFDVGHEAIISYSIDVNFRGRGWGYAVLEWALRAFQQEYDRAIKIIGYVKHENKNSNAIFKNLGFVQSLSKEYPQSFKYEYLKS